VGLIAHDPQVCSPTPPPSPISPTRAGEAAPATNHTHSTEILQYYCVNVPWVLCCGVGGDTWGFPDGDGCVSSVGPGGDGAGLTAGHTPPPPAHTGAQALHGQTGEGALTLRRMQLCLTVCCIVSYCVCIVKISHSLTRAE